VPAAGVIGEAMVMLTLAGFVLEKAGGDSLAEVRDNLERYRERLARPTRGSAASTSSAAGPAATREPGSGEAGSGGDD